MQAHNGALDVQIVIAGLARFGSSKVPTRTKIRCGRTSASLEIGVPQSAQNLRCIRLPLSEMLAKSLVLPTSLNAAVWKQALTVPLPAPKYWQSRHQHTRVTIGASELSQRTVPQRHLPVTTIVFSGIRATPRIVRLHARTSSTMPANPRINRTCSSRLRLLAQAGYAQRYRESH